MGANTVTFTIKLDGNAKTGILELDEALGKLILSGGKTQSLFDKFKNSAFHFDVITNAVEKFSRGLNAAIQPGIDLNSSLQEMSAITGITGKKLKEIEGYARKQAKVFGVDAAGAVDSYKLVLSQLSPELGKSPKALQSMGEHISRLSKLMGGDATAAAGVLNTAMNQYGVDLSNPIAASEEMSRMMNVMAAAANEGSAELPSIKLALEQSGMAAKAAGVSFEEINASIQVLDKAGKQGAEGGVALRNVMNILSRGRFLPKQTLQELNKAGVDVKTLTDKSKTLTERLSPLRKVMGDSALFTKLFGMSNANAAMALVGSVEEIDRLTDAVSGTNMAYEQSETIMDSYAEKQARIEAQFNDIKIAIFNATGDMGIWTQVVASSLVPLAQLAPLFMGVGSAVSFCRKSWSKFAKSIRLGVVKVRAQLVSLVPTTFSVGVAFQVMSKMASAACRAIGVAIMAIPIVGWIAAAIAAIIAVITVLWQRSEGFRRLVMGTWESIKAIFHNYWVVYKTIFMGIWKVVKWCYDQIVQGVVWLYEQIVGIVSSIGSFFSSIWGWVVDTVGVAFEWIVGKLGVVGSWIQEKLVAPVQGAFSNLWEVVKGVFNKILDGLGKLFKPIKELWNKVFPKDKFKDVSVAYSIGAEKGSESYRKSKSGEGSEGSVEVLGSTSSPVSALDTSNSLSSGYLGEVSGSSSGKAQQINITLSNMVGTMNFNGGLQDNARDVEAKLTEMMARILGMAETAV